MERTNKKLIAVVGATGQKGGAVVHALQANKQFKVRALTRNPAKHRELGDEVVQADLNRPETLAAAFEGAHGVFLVTNLWEEGTDEVEQTTAAVRAAKDAGVKQFDPTVRCIHMGDITELGNVVAGAFAHPDQAGHGEYLPLVGDFMSFNEIIDTLNRQGYNFSFNQVPKEVFAGLFPGAAEIAEMFDYFQVHTYLGSDSRDQVALADKIAGRQPTKFSAWARVNFQAAKNAHSAAL